MKKFLALLLTPALLAVTNPLPAQVVPFAYAGQRQTNASPADSWYTLPSYSNSLYNTPPGSNTAAGFNALLDDTGSNNTRINWDTLDNTNRVDNTAIGWDALEDNTNGVDREANDWDAFLNRATGSGNPDAGWESLVANTTGLHNKANAAHASSDNTTGGKAMALEYQAVLNLATDGSNIDIASLGLAGDTNLIRNGAPVTQTNPIIPGRIIGGGLTNLNFGQMPAGVLTNH